MDAKRIGVSAVGGVVGYWAGGRIAKMMPGNKYGKYFGPVLGVAATVVLYNAYGEGIKIQAGNGFSNASGTNRAQYSQRDSNGNVVMAAAPGKAALTSAAVNKTRRQPANPGLSFKERYDKFMKQYFGIGRA